MSADTIYNCPGAISQQYSYDATNRLQTILTEENGTTHTEQFTYDKQGNLLQDGRQTYSYDAFNRTVKVETVEGNYQENRYDAEGLRAEMVENGELVKFLFAGKEVVAETESDGNVVRYIRGYDLISSDSEKAKTYYHYACDEQGSITHLVLGVEKVAETNIATGVSDTRQAIKTPSIDITNHDRNVSLEDRILNRYEYGAFGNTVYSEEKVHNRFRYTGQQYDPIIQQYYLRARYYNPVIARFTQEDTYHGDGLNLYSYCNNNPLMYYDPSGHDGESCGGAKDNDNLEDDGGENKSGNPKTAEERRNSPGVVEGNGRKTSKMMYGTEKNAGVVPEEVADKLRGKQYNNFDEFRKDFWKAVAETDYAKEFLINGDPKNYYRMLNGGAPLVSSDQAINGSYTYQLHHIIPINQGGSVYSVDNLVVVTPRYHAEILIPEVHGYNGFKKYFK